MAVLGNCTDEAGCLLCFEFCYHPWDLGFFQTLYSLLTLTLKSPCLCLQSAETAGVSRYPCLVHFFVFLIACPWLPEGA